MQGFSRDHTMDLFTFYSQAGVQVSQRSPHLSQKSMGRGVTLFLNFLFNSVGLYVYWAAYFLSLIVFALERTCLQCRRSQFDPWVRKIRWRRDRLPTPVFLGLPCGSAGKKSACNSGRPGFDPWFGKIPWRRERLPTLVLWPGKFHGLCSLWGYKGSDMTE